MNPHTKRLAEKIHLQDLKATAEAVCKFKGFTQSFILIYIFQKHCTINYSRPRSSRWICACSDAVCRLLSLRERGFRCVLSRRVSNKCHRLRLDCVRAVRESGPSHEGSSETAAIITAPRLRRSVRRSHKRPEGTEWHHVITNDKSFNAEISQTENDKGERLKSVENNYFKPSESFQSCRPVFYF